MKPHRQFKSSRKVGDPSSKYAYDRQLDEDFNNKASIIESETDKISDFLNDFISKDVLYADGTRMTIQQKWDCLVSASLEIKENYGL